MKMMSMVPGAVPLTPQNALVHASPGARSCTGNCQTACNDRFKAGPLRGDPASPRVSEGTGGACFPVPEWPEPFPVPVTLPKSPVRACFVARSYSGNCQTACDHRLKAGPLRGDWPAPGFQRGREK